MGMSGGYEIESLDLTSLKDSRDRDRDRDRDRERETGGDDEKKILVARLVDSLPPTN